MNTYKTLFSCLFAVTGVVQTLHGQDKVPAQPLQPAQIEQKKEMKEEKKETLGLELGSPLPEVNITTQHGVVVPLAAAEYHRFVFVFFYPKAFTGG